LRNSRYHGLRALARATRKREAQIELPNSLISLWVTIKTIALWVTDAYDADSARPVPTFPMQEVRMVYNYDWSSTYAGAVLESDQRKLSKRILEAELAILRRTREPGLARREWQAMNIAMDILRDMRVRRHNPLYEHRR
jgi:hypothetical protein